MDKRAEEARRYKEKMREDELARSRAQQAPPKAPKAPDSRKNIPCLYYGTKNGCSAGKHCPYLHLDPPAQVQPSRPDTRPPLPPGRASRSPPPSQRRRPHSPDSRSHSPLPRRHERLSSSSSSDAAEYGPRRPDARPRSRSPPPRRGDQRSPPPRPRQGRSRSPDRRNDSYYDAPPPPPRTRSPPRRTNSNTDRSMPPPPPRTNSSSIRDLPLASTSRTVSQGSPAHAAASPVDRGRAPSSEASASSRSGEGGGGARDDARRELGRTEDGPSRDSFIHPDRRASREGSSSSSGAAVGAVKVDVKGKGREVPMHVDPLPSNHQPKINKNCMALVEELLALYSKQHRLEATLLSEETALSDLRALNLPSSLSETRSKALDLKIGNHQNELNLLFPRLHSVANKLLSILSASLSNMHIDQRFDAHKTESEERERKLGERFEKLEARQEGSEEERRSWKEERMGLEGRLDEQMKSKEALEERVRVLEGEVKKGVQEGVENALKLNTRLDGLKKEVEEQRSRAQTAPSSSPAPSSAPTTLNPSQIEQITALVSSLLPTQTPSQPTPTPTPAPAPTTQPPPTTQETPIIFTIDGKPCSDLIQALRFLASALESFAGETNGRFGVLEGQLASFNEMLGIE